MLPFRLRGIAGRVRIMYGTNDDPTRWGYHVLGLNYDIEVARGFPVVEATVEYEAEGYAAILGWVQAVRYSLGDKTEITRVVPDVAPQLAEARMPYLAFGIRPVMFDAPSIEGVADAEWRAWSFLTYSPDALMTPNIEPLCGFTWGYDLRDAVPESKPLEVVGRGEWLDVREELRAALREWTFGGGESEPETDET
jgi:hypothetical protein